MIKALDIGQTALRTSLWRATVRQMELDPVMVSSEDNCLFSGVVGTARADRYSNSSHL